MKPRKQDLNGRKDDGNLMVEAGFWYQYPSKWAELEDRRDSKRGYKNPAFQQQQACCPLKSPGK